ncbi:MAG TPA: VOC family protein [Candidatus Paceibacterota bacterium]|nr:VOC family protein [Candidatus Paceibacterota bacterium]
MQKITPHLWFDTNAEEAAKFYTSIFKDGKIGAVARYPEAGKEVHGMEPGTAMTVEFEIVGYKLLALNGGPIFTFTPAVSFTANCLSKEEVDELWEKLSEGGTVLMPLDAYPFSERYGWLKDKYGLTWQLIFTPEAPSRTITPALMFTGGNCGKAEEAISFYTQVFKDGKVGMIARYDAAHAPDKEGTIMYADFTLAGQRFSAMDSAREHTFTFNEAVSLLITCENQEEIDYFWEKLSAVPESEQCGWLKDKYGVSWQIVPRGMGKMLTNPDKEKANRAMQAMLQMKKIDISKLQEAQEG